MEVIEKLNELMQAGDNCVVITVVEKSGEGPVSVGKKMLLTKQHEMYGTVGGGALEHEAIEIAKGLLVSGECHMEKFLLNEGNVVKDATTLPMACGGMATLFFEYMGPKAEVVIFGGGHVSQALVNVLKTLDFYITVIDPREDVMAEFEGANRKAVMDFVPYLEENPAKSNQYIITCTPSHKYDFDVFDKIFKDKRAPKYMGLLCSKKKMRDYVARTYENFGNDTDLTNFYGPVGLDTGGGSPAEIAVSIAAEILALHHNKEGHKHMRLVISADEK